MLSFLECDRIKSFKFYCGLTDDLITVFNLWPGAKLFDLYTIESLNWEEVFAQHC